MRIYLMGMGSRLQLIRDALEPPRQTIRVVEKNPETFRFIPPDNPISSGDLVIVWRDRRRAPEGPAGQPPRPGATREGNGVRPRPLRPLLRDYPGFIFSDEKLIYRNELRGLMRKAAVLHKVETIRSLVRGFPLLTVIWGNPDPDAIASAFALGELVQGHARESAIAYMGEFTRPENAAMVSMLKIPMRRFTPDLLQCPIR